LLFVARVQVVLRMRKANSAVAAKKSVQAAGSVEAPVELVCLALLLAIAALVCRIASIW
jgi:hypothetical protein